jgi:hypothetical protein
MGFYSKKEPVCQAVERPVTATLSRVRDAGPQNAIPPILTVGIGHRFYNPGLGRWLSRDPIGESSAPDMLSFVGNHPTIAVDSLGLQEVVRMPQIGVVNRDFQHVGVLTPDAVNCLGYACRLPGKVDPAPKASMKDLLDALGYECTEGIPAAKCKEHCKCRDYIMVYVYAKEPNDFGRVNQRYRNTDVFRSPVWGKDSASDIDFHALRGEDAGYTYQPIKALRGDDADMTGNPEHFFPSKDQPEVFNKKTELGKACCCRRETP